MGILAHKTEASATPQVPLLATDQNFAAIHSRFKIILLLSTGEGLCYYGQEASASMEDMLSGKAKEITLDAEKGYNDCLQQLQKAHVAAVIYRKKYDEWKPVASYHRGKALEEVPLTFNQHQRRFAVVVKDSMLSLERRDAVTL